MTIFYFSQNLTKRNKKRRNRKPKVEGNFNLYKMKKTFFKFGLFLALGLTIVVFNSCEKDDDIDQGINDFNASKITATNVINGTTRVITVKALAYWESGDDYFRDTIVQAPYKNNGFTLELPAILGAKYLQLDAFDLEGIFVSDRNFKSLFFYDVVGYNEDDTEIGYFYLEEDNYNITHYTSWMYVDRDVTIKGEVNKPYGIFYEENKYDLTLKKGWNLVYDSHENDGYSFTMTSNKPSGVN
jgi:hypothetical protein